MPKIKSKDKANPDPRQRKITDFWSKTNYEYFEKWSRYCGILAICFGSLIDCVEE